MTCTKFHQTTFIFFQFPSLRIILLSGANHIVKQNFLIKKIFIKLSIQFVQKSTTKNLLPKIYYQKSTIKNLLPKIYYQKSTIKNLLPKIYYQKSTIKIYYKNLLSKIYYQKSTIKNLLPKIYYQKSTTSQTNLKAKQQPHYRPGVAQRVPVS